MSKRIEIILNDIQYMKKDLCDGFCMKAPFYLLYQSVMLQSNEWFPIDDIYSKHPFLRKEYTPMGADELVTPEELIIDKFIESVKQYSWRVSYLSSYLAHIEEICVKFASQMNADSIDSLRELVAYYVKPVTKETPCRLTSVTPNVVAMFNSKNSQLTGTFFENVLYYALITHVQYLQAACEGADAVTDKIDSTVSFIGDSFRTHSVEKHDNMLKSLLSTHFFKDPAWNIEIFDGFSIYCNNEPLMTKHFKNIYSALLWMSVVQHSKHSLELGILPDVYSFAKKVVTYEHLLTDYVKKLRHEPFVKEIVKENPTSNTIIHGKSGTHEKGYRGDIDILTRTAILEVKCCKNNEYQAWMKQAALYKEMFSNDEYPIKKLYVINLLQNEYRRYDVY